MKRLAVKLTEKIQSALLAPATKAAGKAQVKKKAKESVLAKLEQGKAEIARRDAERRARPTPKQDMER